MTFSKMTWAFYCLFSFTFLFSSCQHEEEYEQPQPIAEQPAPQPERPDECITKPSADNGNVIEGQYVVKYHDDNQQIGVNSTDSPARILSRVNIHGTNARQLFNGRFKAMAVKLNSQEVKNLRKDPSIESIEPDRIVSIASCYTEINTQSIPWGVVRVGGATDASGKNVWIIDTGVDLDHPDLNVDVAKCKSFISGTTPEDDHGHGTHVAGTIAAKNNYVGVVGVAANARVIALKVMDASGKGSMSNVISAVNWVKQNGKAGDVVNMSIGGEISPILDEAVADAAAKGILFAIAAGNSSTEATSSSPAAVNHKNVFTVSAMNVEDSWASFSNYGSTCVDYCAPGVNIPSTHKNGGYATMSGTSMATPHLAGILVLNGNNIKTDGFVKNDPDGKQDPIAHK
jgi:subtilisin family serine protease